MPSGAVRWGRPWGLGLGLCRFRWIGEFSSPFFSPGRFYVGEVGEVGADADADGIRDRPWQAFPITILTGAYIGFAVGSVVCRSSWLFGKWLEFMPPPEDDEVREKKME